MSKYIHVSRLEEAIINLSNWRGSVKQQSVAHILPLLAIVEKGVTPTTLVKYEEADDFDFFNRYCRIDSRPGFPYFDPFTREYRIESHPHSNIATARKNTFQNRWKAIVSEDNNGATYWKLSSEYASILASKLFTKQGQISRINLLDISIWLFRSETFSEEANAKTIKDLFLSRFNFAQNDFDQLFEYIEEPDSRLFQASVLSIGEITRITNKLEIKPVQEIEGVISGASFPTDSSTLEVGDPILLEVMSLLEFGSSGVIFRGAPGTGKSWYVSRIAEALVGKDQERIFRVQFHQSYTYEDFFDGFIPSDDTKSGFVVEGKVLRKAVEVARASRKVTVLLIDEINRGNTGKIFGEALTYIEHGWRDVEFIPRLSRTPLSIPKNLVLLATMNPYDRNITALDMALLRRFDHIDILPNPEIASKFLESSGMKNVLIGPIVEWFETLQNLLPFGIGHTFFLHVGDLGKLGLAWRYRILPFCKSVLEFEEDRLQSVIQSYGALERRLREIENQ